MANRSSHKLSGFSSKEMDTDLINFLQSAEPNSSKSAVVERLIIDGQKDIDMLCQTFNAKLKSCIYIMTLNNSTLTFELSRKLFLEWGSSHRHLFTMFFDSNLVRYLLFEKTFHNPQNVVWIIKHGLSIVRGYNPKSYDDLCMTIRQQVIHFIRLNSTQFEVLTKLCGLLFEHRDCLSRESYQNFCSILLPLMTSCYYDRASLASLTDDVRSNVGVLLEEIWHDDTNAALMSVQNIFKAIFTEKGFCAPLGCIVQFMPDSIMTMEVSNVATSQSIENFVVNALCHMTSWLLLPFNEKIAEWVIMFLQNLVRERKYRVLVQVAEGQTLPVFEGLRQDSTRMQCFTVVFHLLLGYQCNPSVFHQIIPAVPETITEMRKEAGAGCESAIYVLPRLVELLYCLLHFHSGYPHRYALVMNSIRSYPKPSIVVMDKFLKKHVWFTRGEFISNTVERRPMLGRVMDLRDGGDDREDSDLEQKKVTTELTGLTNLGNTCYMNGVLQCLYMCDCFREKIMAASPDTSQTMLTGLQRVFAFLMLSQRPACSPEQFFKDAKPPWFNADLQHDCSEFLRHLLDQLHEQEVALRPPPPISPNKSETETGSAAKTKKKNSLHSWGFRKLFKFGKPKPTPSSWDLARPSESSASLISETFGGRLMSTCVCMFCKSESSRFESFTDLTLAFPADVTVGKRSNNFDQQQQQQFPFVADHNENVFEAGSSGFKTIALQSMLQQFMKPEQLVDTNRYQCSKCECLRDGVRRISIATAPSCLVLVLLRFAYDAETRCNEKVCTNVDFPLTLFIPVAAAASDSSETAIGNSAAASSSTVRLVQYGLCGVIVHAGTSSEGGHYYTYARHCRQVVRPPREKSSTRPFVGDRVSVSDTDCFADEWYMFNDEHVTSSSFDEIRNVTVDFPKDTPYVLFYKRVDPPTADAKPLSKDRSLANGIQHIRPDLIEMVENDNTLYKKSVERRDKHRRTDRNHVKSYAASGNVRRPMTFTAVNYK